MEGDGLATDGIAAHPLGRQRRRVIVGGGDQVDLLADGADDLVQADVGVQRQRAELGEVGSASDVGERGAAGVPPKV